MLGVKTITLLILLGSVFANCSQQPEPTPRTASKNVDDDDDDDDDYIDTEESNSDSNWQDNKRSEPDSEKEEVTSTKDKFGDTNGSGGKKGDHADSFKAKNYEFDYLLKTPSDYKESKARCITFYFHGNATPLVPAWEYDLDNIITDKGCIAVMPIAPYPNAWGGPGDAKIEEVGEGIVELIEEIADKYNFKKSEVTLAGYSAGANLITSALLPLLEDYKGLLIQIAGGGYPLYSTSWYETDKPQEQWKSHLFAAPADTFMRETTLTYDHLKDEGFDTKLTKTTNTMHTNYDQGQIIGDHLID